VVNNNTAGVAIPGAGIMDEIDDRYNTTSINLLT